MKYMTMFLKSKRRLTVTALFIVFIVILYTFLSVSDDWSYRYTFDYECRSNGTSPFPEVVHYCIRGPTIFLAETSGRKSFTPRQACAVESAARENPSMSVTALITGDDLDISDPITAEIATISNVNIRVINLDVFVHDTPIWAWYRKGQWKKSKWKISHLSDGLRFLLMWKYGGMYLDLDTVTLRSMEHIVNSVVTENWDRVAAGILIFQQGHELMDRCIVDFALHYDKDNFASNGPGVIGRNIKAHCDVEDIGKVSGSGCGVTILPPEFAFPIPFEEWDKYFTPNTVKNIAKHFSTSYLIHVWNKYSFEGRVVIGENSLYETAMKEHCPIVYKHAKKLLYV